MAWLAADEDHPTVLRCDEGATVRVLLLSTRGPLAEQVSEAARRNGLDAVQVKADGHIADLLDSLPGPGILMLDLNGPGADQLEQAVPAAEARGIALVLIADDEAPVLPACLPDVVQVLSGATTGALTAILAEAAAQAVAGDAKVAAGGTLPLLDRAVQDARRLLDSVEALRRSSRIEPPSAPNPLGRVEAMIRARQARNRLFGAEMFADPAWDMLLDLFAHHLRGQRVTVSSLCIAASVPQTTALRRLDDMLNARMIVKERDPGDGRRIFVRLTSRTAARLQQFVEEHGFAP